MKVALLGYGKMGRAIERLALEKGHEVVLKISRENLRELTQENLRRADAAIEFSQPETAFQNVALCLRAGVPVACGTTGWHDRLEEARSLCRSLNGAFFYAANFSVGVNLFFALNRILAKMMGGQPAYEARIEETHHAAKLDAPSGTALALANGILENSGRKRRWVGRMAGTAAQAVETSPEELEIISKREGAVPGTHLVTWSSALDEIEIKHAAHSREGFPAGALAAAEWLQGRQGCFEMKDMLGF